MTDGTEKATKVLLNGKPIDNLSYVNASFWPGDMAPSFSFFNYNLKTRSSCVIITC